MCMRITFEAIWQDYRIIRINRIMNLKSSFRFPAPSCYIIARRGAECESLRDCPPIRCVFIFTNWVKFDLRISLHVFSFSVDSRKTLWSLPLCASAWDFQPRILGWNRNSENKKSCKSCLKNLSVRKREVTNLYSMRSNLSTTWNSL